VIIDKASFARSAQNKALFVLNRCKKAVLQNIYLLWGQCVKDGSLMLFREWHNILFGPVFSMR
jgi:hypothetical protein